MTKENPKPRSFRRRVFLNPDGTHDMGHYALVLAPTGVHYATQCNGSSNDENSAEGYLVTVGPADAMRRLQRWMKHQQQKHCGAPASTWPVEHQNELARLVSELQLWRCDSDHETSSPVALDRSRLRRCHEAWIPIDTSSGPAWLLGTNSD